MILAVTVAAVLLAGAFLLGLVVGRPGSKAVTVTDTFTGTVQLVNGTGGSVCIAPDGGGAERCSIALTHDTPRQGQHVKIAALKIDQSGGDSYEAFALYPDQP